MYFAKLSKLQIGEKMKNKQKTRVISAVLIIASLLFLTLSSSIQIKAAYPKQRLYHKMIYDSVNDRIIMYGGSTAPGYENFIFDTWAYDYNNNNWTKLITENSPYAWHSVLPGVDADNG